MDERDPQLMPAAEESQEGLQAEQEPSRGNEVTEAPRPSFIRDYPTLGYE